LTASGLIGIWRQSWRRRRRRRNEISLFRSATNHDPCFGAGVPFGAGFLNGDLTSPGFVVALVGDPAAWTAAIGIAPQSLTEIFAERPASVQDRWHARLFLIKPLAIAALALFWVVTGLVTIGPGYGAAAAQLAASGFPAALVGPAVFWGGWFDVVLGLLLPVRRFTRPVLLLMLAVTPFYLLIGTLLAPHLWLDPLGPLLKIVPALLATAFTLAIVDER